MNYYPYCVYTIVNGEVLDSVALDRRSLIHTERKRWVTAASYLSDAKSKDEHIPVLLGDARDCSKLLYWGLLKKIEVHETGTTYEVDLLRPFLSGHAPQELVLSKSEEHIAPGFIRPYALCRTPAFLDESSTASGTFLSPEEGPVPETYFEGSALRITVNSYERSVTARNICIKHYGCICSVCGFNFENTYGAIGHGFIQVHHVKPLAEIGERYAVDPIADLRPVCPNCHAMLHTSSPAMSIEELKKLIRK